VTPEIVVVPAAAALAEEAARRFAARAEAAVAAWGRFSVALSGGTTPGALYRRLAAGPYRVRLPWAQVHLFWADERCVPPDAPDSNYRLVAETLLAGAPLPPENIHRMRGEWEPERAARDYEQTLRAYFGNAPRFDLVLLGLGKDGHTASLFPGTETLAETARWVVPASAEYEDRPAWRITLTLPALNAARHIIFLVSGAEKAAIVRTVLTEPEAGLPAQRVQPADGEVVWLLDAKAGCAVTPKHRRG